MHQLDGIVGVCYAYSVIDTCSNEGNIIGEGSALGGIVGNAYYNVQKCENKGEVTNNGTTVDNNRYIGGVAGSNAGIISNCKNYANIIGNSAFSSYVGGIIGEQHISNMSFLDVVIKDCFNTGSISGNTCVGGVAGRNSNSASIDSCYNTGNVSGAERIGGVIGDTITTSGEAKNLYNKGIVTATTNYVGGIVGILYSSLENAYNTGTVSMTSSSTTFGGITGHINTNYVTIDIIRNCYYLNTTVIKAIGNISTIDITSRKTSDEIKTLADTLGDAFKNSTEGDGYPKLSWEE